RTIHYSGAPYFPPVDPDSVMLLRKEPHRPHVQLGEVRFYPSPGMSPSYVEYRLREKAAEMGAHALVMLADNVYNNAVVYGSYWRRHIHVYKERVLVGVAIHFTR
ncbi:MAG: hypothetical protein A2Y62_20315, partial [Candidatus Fischerbacteria bacterium RBG_13_37_8]